MAADALALMCLSLLIRLVTAAAMLAADAQVLPLTAILTADAQDAAGNAAIQQTFNVLHDVIAPSVQITNAVIANAANSSAYAVYGSCTAGDNNVVVKICFFVENSFFVENNVFVENMAFCENMAFVENVVFGENMIFFMKT